MLNIIILNIIDYYKNSVFCLNKLNEIEFQFPFFVYNAVIEHVM